MDPILEQFLSEARENLSFLDQNLNQLQNNDPEIVNALFRAAHTLKGGAGLVGLEGVKNITHHAEDLLDGLKKNTLQYSDNMLDALYDAFDEVIEQIDATEELGEPCEYDESIIEKIVNEIKSVMGYTQENECDDSLDTELNIALDEEDIKIGELVSNKDIKLFINNIPFKHPHIDQAFLEEDNIYLIDIDLDQESCEVGNDPIYLIYLLEEENLLSANVSIMADCQDIKDEPLSWKTRLSIVVKSNKDMLEDSFYNILDEITIYPLSVKTLLSTNYESNQNDIFDDFAKEFQDILESGNYEELSEKLSAVIKILNPESKEGFILSRLETILPYFEFEGIDYLEIVKLASKILNLTTEQSCDEENTNSSTSETAQNSQSNEAIIENDMSPEKQNAINILSQQLKVLELSSDDSALSRVKLFVTRALEFINYDIKFNLDLIFEKV